MMVNPEAEQPNNKCWKLQGRAKTPKLLQGQVTISLREEPKKREITVDRFYD